MLIKPVLADHWVELGGGLLALLGFCLPQCELALGYYSDQSDAEGILHSLAHLQ